MTRRKIVNGAAWCLLAVGLATGGRANDARPPEAQVKGPFPNLVFEPVTVTWQYGTDGTSFGPTPLAGPPQGMKYSKNPPKYPYAWKGEFEIADPTKVGGLWIRLFDERPDGTPSKASICNGDQRAASCGDWENLGYCPTLLDAQLKFNGQPVKIAQGPLLQLWVPLTGDMKQGKNTVELSGHVYTFFKESPAKALEARLIKAAPQPVEIYGPVVGDSGDGYFTVSCRTQMPAEVTIEAKPVEPAGSPVKAVSSGSVWHRAKIEVPSGTRAVEYTLAAKVGEHVTKTGPFRLRLHPTDGEYRFIAFGHAMQHRGGPPWDNYSQQILKADPAFVVNSGDTVEMGSWLFDWQTGFYAPGADLLASVPQLATPGRHDISGIFDETYVTPAADGYSHNWTKVVGPVRFIGIDSHRPWEPGNENYTWLEGVLTAAKEKFVVVLCGHPGYSSGINSKKPYGALHQVREVIMPLLGKHKATMMLSSWDPNYERLEPTPDKGCTQLVTGAIGFKTFHRWDTRFGSHPFGPGGEANARGTSGVVKLADGREWCGHLGHHFCVFDVKPDAIELTVLVPAGKPEVPMKDLPVVDRKIFKPR